MSYEEDDRKVDLRMLRVLDLADERGAKLSMPSVVKVMEEGYTLEDFLAGEEKRLSGVRANTRCSILGLLDDMDPEDLARLKGGKSLYRLALTDGGVSEQIVRNLLHPSGLSYEQLEGLDYETFRRMTGGGERHATFAKLTRSFQADGGAWEVRGCREGSSPAQDWRAPAQPD